MELMGTSKSLSQGDERDSISEWHFVEQLRSIVERVKRNVKVEKYVLGEQVQRNRTLENVGVESLAQVGVTVLDSMLEHASIRMRIEERRLVMVKVSRKEAWREGAMCR